MSNYVDVELIEGDGGEIEFSQSITYREFLELKWSAMLIKVYEQRVGYM